MLLELPKPRFPKDQGFSSELFRWTMSSYGTNKIVGIVDLSELKNRFFRKIAGPEYDLVICSRVTGTIKKFEYISQEIPNGATETVFRYREIKGTLLIYIIND